MSQQELLNRVVDVLETLKVDYMVTGSIASSFLGEPRSTHDVDLLVQLPVEAIKPLASAFASPEYYLTEDMIRDAFQSRSMFNLLSLVDGNKVDFWILTDEPFDRSRFSRRKPVNIQGRTYQMSSPEDTILVKLHWAKLSGGSEKQFHDALRVLEVQHQLLDRNYLDRWAKELDVEAPWQQLLSEALTQ